MAQAKCFQEEKKFHYQYQSEIFRFGKLLLGIMRIFRFLIDTASFHEIL